MSVIAIVHLFGGQPALNIAKQTYWFDHEPPQLDWIIDVDHNAAVERGNVLWLPPSSWRRLELRELLDPSRSQIERRSATRNVLRAYTLDELTDFYDDFSPQVLTRSREILAAPNDTQANALLRKHQEFLDICGLIFAALPTKVRRRGLEIAARGEEARVDALLATSPTRTQIAELLFNLSDQPQRLRLMETWLDELTTEELTNAQIEVELRNLRPLGANDLNRNPVIWNRISGLFDFAQKLSGETIDITNAVEGRFQPFHKILDAKRVGRLKPQRPVLYVYSGNRQLTHAIGADRRLQFAVVAAGGSLRKWGVTFTMGGQDSLAESLITVERLELLANVDPAAAVRELDSELAEDHPIRRAAARAETDYRWGRILADLLIEHVVGIDADIARRIIRSRSASR